MPSKTAPSLRARRSGRIPQESKLDRTRLISDPDVTPDTKSSPLKSVVWFFIVIGLALVTYLGLKSYLTGDEEETLNPTATPTIVVEDNSIVETSVLDDNPVEPFTNTTYWNDKSKQIQSTSEDTLFVVESIKVQPYESYLSFIYELSGGSVSDFPQVTAEMLEDISLTFENISLNSSFVEIDDIIQINSQNVTSLTRIGYSDQVDSYLIDLTQSSPFTLYSKVENDRKLVVLDVLYPEDEQTPVSPTTLTTPTPTTSIVPTKLPDGAENYTNEYSRNEQKIITSTTGKTVKISKYNYFDSSDRFTYNLLVTEGIPNAVASLEGNTLILQVSNLALDGVVGNGGSGSTDLTATGVVHVQKVDISNSDGVSEYIFTLDGQRDFRLIADKDAGVLTLEIKR